MAPKISRRVAHLGPQPILRLRFPNGGARWVVGGGMGVCAELYQSINRSVLRWVGAKVRRQPRPWPKLES